MFLGLILSSRSSGEAHLSLPIVLRDGRRLASNASRGPRRVRQYDRLQSILTQFSLKRVERNSPDHILTRTRVDQSIADEQSEKVVTIPCREHGVIADGFWSKMCEQWSPCPMLAWKPVPVTCEPCL